ncbi:hypothetical protein ABKV19_008915 [Rosa sericea]
MAAVRLNAKIFTDGYFSLYPCKLEEVNIKCGEISKFTDLKPGSCSSFTLHLLHFIHRAVSLFSSATSLPTLWSSLSPPLPRTEEALGTLPGRTRFLNKCSVSTSFSVQASLPENSDRFKVEYTPWMIVGLGNPGNKYHGTRHNVGFEMIDSISKMQGIVMNTIQSKALVGIGSIGEVPILVVKPQAYMNYSGEASFF